MGNKINEEAKCSDCGTPLPREIEIISAGGRFPDARAARKCPKCGKSHYVNFAKYEKLLGEGFKE